jgi:hypothetical protein
MREVDSYPRDFPGTQACRVAHDVEGSNRTVEYFYDIWSERRARTTTGAEICLPQVDHRCVAELTVSGYGTMLYAGRATGLNRKGLTEEERQAIEIASLLAEKREAQDPTVTEFPMLHRLDVGKNGVAYLVQSREGPGIDTANIYMPVASALCLGTVVCATTIHNEGYLMLDYHQADIEQFVPEAVRDRVNAYSRASVSAQTVSDPEGTPLFHVWQVGLLDVVTDQSLSVGELEEIASLI